MVQTAYDTRMLSNTDTDIPAGFDGGNTDTAFSAVVNGQEKFTVIPSTVNEVDGEQLEELEGGVAKEKRNRFVDPYNQKISIEFNDRYYLVGYSAMSQVKNARTQKGDNGRYYSDEQLIRLLAVSAATIPYNNYCVKVVTTVPLEFYSKQLRKAIKQKLSGVHKFKFNGVEKQAVIDVKQILIEGSPALILYGEQSVDQRRIVIDGGGYTTEFLMFDGTEPIAELCKGVSIGVENIADLLYNKIFRKYQRRLTTLEKSQILRAYGSHQTAHPMKYPEILAGADPIQTQEIHAICTEGARKLAENTMKEAGALWGRVGDVIAGDTRYQYQIGGSVHFINNFLRDSYMPLLQPIPDAERTNAEGCLRIAKVL